MAAHAAKDVEAFERQAGGIYLGVAGVLFAMRGQLVANADAATCVGFDGG